MGTGSPLKMIKNVLFYLKSSFRFQDISIFALNFWSVRKTDLKVNFKIYDVTNWVTNKFFKLQAISLLPLISKIIEKLIYEQRSSFLSSNEILYNYQSGFRKNHSTDSCLTFLYDKILKCSDKGLILGNDTD